MSGRITELFNNNVFTDAEMKARLPKKVYNEVKACKLDKGSADIVAQAVRDWAIEKGATHFTHVFEPLTMLTAEKHDSFVSLPDEDGKVMMDFTGKELCESEPDGSSFPSGGIRDTSRARSYTSWDMTSPIYVKEDAIGTILCIPAAFCSYTGEALDAKTPLLRSMDAVSEQGVRLLRLLGNTTSTKVTAGVGPEQEYFIVNREKYLERPDLIYAGRTLFGAPAPKGQEMEDQYFGPLKTKIADFMADVDEQLWKLGITVKTQHNEVAPAQHELAPIYDQANLAVDHNQMVMETLKKVAGRQGLTCLLHEKPFAGVNGSGKHNNWSITTDDGINLLEPGKTPHENIQFLLVLTCILKAVDRHADLLREAAADVGNDHRLGANEAPPAIVSVYLGEQLQDVLSQLISTGEATHSLAGQKLETGVKTLPDFMKDATDRNRTSPFAFTGNRFEFRAVGSSDNCADAMITLNTAVAYQLKEFKADIDKLIAEGHTKENAIFTVLKRYTVACKPIRFEGNGYSDEWKAEAARRGLDCETSVPLIFDRLLAQENIRMFGETGVLNEVELHARAEVKWETYTKKVQIEARILGDLAMNHILPVASRYQSMLLDKVSKFMAIFPKEKARVLAEQDLELIEKIARHMTCIQTQVEAMVETRKVINKMGDIREKAIAYHDRIAPTFDEIRAHIDKLELIVDNEMWTLPKYRELLFLR